MKTLKTQRLILRSFTLDDVDDFYEYCKNPNVGIHAGWTPHKNKEESLEILEQFIEGGEIWAIVARHNNKVIGSIGLHDDKRRNNPHVKMLGYVLAEEHWGSGIMFEAATEVVKHAFVDLGVGMLTVYHFAYNRRSKGVIDKLGFIFEGTMRNATYRFDGETLDDMCYSMTKDEYFAR